MRFVSRIGQFFVDVVRSSYDMEWYRAIRVRPLGQAVRYAVGLHFVIVLLTVMAVAPAMFAAKRELATYVRERLPDGATFTVQRGELSTNVPQPFEAGSKEFPVIIDTSLKGAEAGERLGTQPGAVFGRDVIVLQKDRVERRTYRLAEMPDGSVTKEQMLDWIARYATPAIIAFLLMFMLAMWAGLLIGTGIYVAIASLAAMVIAKIWGVALAYRQWFAVGLHAVTLPLIVSAVLDAMRVRIPFAFSFIYFMFVIAVVADEKATPTPSFKESATPSSPPPVRPAGNPGSRKIAKRRPPPRKPRPPSPPAPTPPPGPGPTIPS